MALGLLFLKAGCWQQHSRTYSQERRRKQQKGLMSAQHFAFPLREAAWPLLCPQPTCTAGSEDGVGFPFPPLRRSLPLPSGGLFLLAF